MEQKLDLDKFKRLLDVLANDQPDTMRLNLFINEYEENANVFGNTKKVVLADFRQDIVVVENNSIALDISDKYIMPIIKRASISKVEEDFGRSTTKVYDNMIAGYIDKELLLANICKSFGVSLSSDFSKVQTEDFETLMGYIDDYYTLTEEQTKYPFGAKKVNQEYKTYISGELLLKVGQFLIERGIFHKESTGYQWVANVKRNHVYPVIDTYNTDELFNYMCNAKVGSSLDDGRLDKCIAMYNFAKSEGLISTDKVRVMAIIASNTSNSFMDIYEIPRERFSLNTENTGYNTFMQSTALSSGTFKFRVDSEEYTYYKHAITLKADGTISYATTTYTHDAKPVSVSLRQRYFTIMNFGDISSKMYKYVAKSNSYYSFYKAGVLDYLNDFIDTTGIRKLNATDFYKNISIGSDTYNNLFSEYQPSISENDIAIYFGTIANISTSGAGSVIQPPTSGVLYIIKNLKDFKITTKSDSSYTGLALGTDCNMPYNFLDAISDSRIDDIVYGLSSYSAGFSHGALNSHAITTIESNFTFDVEKYVYDSVNDEYSSARFENISTYDFRMEDFKLSYITSSGEKIATTASSTCYATYWNLGYIETNKPVTYEGYDLEEGAIYPTSLGNITDLVNTYDEYKNYRTVNSVVEFLGDGTNYTPTQIKDITWLPMTVTETVDQSHTLDGTIDEDNFDILIKDITEAGDDVNEDETKNKPSTNIGNTPDIPDIGDLVSVIGQGGMNQYYLNATQLSDIFESLFSLTPTTLVQNLFGNPLDFIVSLQLTYLNPDTGNAEPVKVGPYTLKTDDEHVPHPVSALPVSEEYISIDCGSVDLSPYFDTYLDYTATSVQLFLPFVGFVGFDYTEFIGGKLHIKAIADTLVGTIVYYLVCEKDGFSQTLYQYAGNCQQQIPLNGANMGRFMGDCLKSAGAIAGVVGGVGAVAASSIAGATGAAVGLAGAGSYQRGSYGSNISGAIDIAQDSFSAAGGLDTIKAGAGKVEKNLQSLPQFNIARGGYMGANLGIMSFKQPFLIIKRNAEYNPNKLETLVGFPSNNYVKLSNCSGYQKVKAVHTSGINATQDEKDMIETILKSGVII